jgi:hypothetical protein
MSARESLLSFTGDELRILLSEAQGHVSSFFIYPHPSYQSSAVNFEPRRHDNNDVHEEHDNILRRTIVSLLDATADPSTHLQAVDDVISPTLAIYLGPERADELDYAVEQAVPLLERLPAVPPQVDKSYPVWRGRLKERFAQYINAEAISADDSTSHWSDLQVVTKFSAATLRLALLCTGDQMRAQM